MAHPVLIDTSVWVEAMRRQGDLDARRLVAATMASGAARTCDFVQLELWNGVSGAEERRWLTEVEAAIEIVPTSSEVWTQARQLATAARERGLTIPASDLLIAACARIHGLTVLHRDAHFDRLAELVPGHGV